jgi:hypothetical protein
MTRGWAQVSREEVTIQACLYMGPGLHPHRLWHGSQAFGLGLERSGSTLDRQIEGYLGMIGTSTGGAAWEGRMLHGQTTGNSGDGGGLSQWVEGECPEDSDNGRLGDLRMCEAHARRRTACRPLPCALPLPFPLDARRACGGRVEVWNRSCPLDPGIAQEPTSTGNPCWGRPQSPQTRRRPPHCVRACDSATGDCVVEDAAAAETALDGEIERRRTQSLGWRIRRSGNGLWISPQQQVSQCFS